MFPLASGYIGKVTDFRLLAADVSTSIMGRILADYRRRYKSG